MLTKGLGRAAILPMSLLAFAAGCAGAQVDVKPLPPGDDGPPRLGEDGTYTVAGLRYIELVTGGASPDEPLPLVVALHGNNGNPKSFAAYFERFPMKARFVVPFGFEQKASGNYAWTPAVAHMPDDELAMRLPPILERLAVAVERIEHARPTVGKPVLVGFSQGAYLSYALAATHGDLVAAACPFAGMMPEKMILAAASLPKGAVIHGMHGADDTTVPPESGRHTVELLQKAGFRADFTEVPGVGHDIRPAAEQLFQCVARSITNAPAPPAP